MQYYANSEKIAGIIESTNINIDFIKVLINQKYKNVKFDFLIVLRNQYDLIKSIYHFNYHKISKILRIKDFKLIFKN